MDPPRRAAWSSYAFIDPRSGFRGRRIRFGAVSSNFDAHGPTEEPSSNSGPTKVAVLDQIYCYANEKAGRTYETEKRTYPFLGLVHEGLPLPDCAGWFRISSTWRNASGLTRVSPANGCSSARMDSNTIPMVRARAVDITACRRPLLVHHQPGIVAKLCLQLLADLGGEDLGVTIQVGQRIGFLLRALLGPPELLPDDDRGEAEQYGVDHADDGVNETGHVIVAREDLSADSAADQKRAAGRKPSAGVETYQNRDDDERIPRVGFPNENSANRHS